MPELNGVKIINPVTGAWVTLSGAPDVRAVDLDAFVRGYQERLVDEWRERHPAAERTFTAPAPGFYHFSGADAPHSIIECGSQCRGGWRFTREAVSLRSVEFDSELANPVPLRPAATPFRDLPRRRVPQHD